jgi:hypothetical protein
MVLAISFLETPLKFRAPGITLALGLGIGRLVFRALNRVEAILAIALIAVCAAGLRPSTTSWVLLGIVAVLLVVQIGVLRPQLDRRALQIIAGREVAPSSHHLAYIGLEVAKIALLVALGWTLVSSALR